MSEIVTLEQVRNARREDRIWAVIATTGRLTRVAEIYPTQEAAPGGPHVARAAGARVRAVPAAVAATGAFVQRGADPACRPATELATAAGARLSARTPELRSD